MTVSAARRPRVLVVAYDFPPHAAIGTMRTLRVVRELADREWDVTVLTGDPQSYLPGTPVDPALMDKVPAGVRVIRAGAVRPWQAFQRMLRPSSDRDRGTAEARAARPRRSPVVSAVARIKDVFDAALAIPDRESGWLVPALLTGVMRHIGEQRPDVIYSSAPPWTGQLVAGGLKLALRRPWVADFRDPWSRAPWRGDRYRFAMRAAAWLERCVVQHADRIVFVASANRDDFARVYGPSRSGRWDVVANGCDPAELEGLRRTQDAGGPTFVMLHAGSLYAGRTPVPLLKALATAIAAGRIDPSKFTLRFLGANGLQGVDLPGVCRDLGLHHVVEMMPRVPREESLRQMMSASCLLLLQPGHAVSVPGKVYEYLATGRPILAIAEGETAELVRRAGKGISVEGENGLVDGLVEAVERDWSRVPSPSRELYDGTVGAARIADILGFVTAGRDGAARLTALDVKHEARAELDS